MLAIGVSIRREHVADLNVADQRSAIRNQDFCASVATGLAVNHKFIQRIRHPHESLKRCVRTRSYKVYRRCNKDVKLKCQRRHRVKSSIIRPGFPLIFLTGNCRFRSTDPIDTRLWLGTPYLRDDCDAPSNWNRTCFSCSRSGNGWRRSRFRQYRLHGINCSTRTNQK